MDKETINKQFIEKKNTSVSFFYTGEYKRAIECLYELLIYEHNNPMHYYNLAICYERLGLKKEAIYAYEKFIEYREDAVEITRVRNLLQTMTRECTLDAAQQAIQLLPQQRIIPWHQAKGDKILRLDYDLNEESIVFDLGGYQGKWTASIFERYGSKIHVFEPVIEYAEHIEQKFFHTPKIKVYNFGLGKNTEKVILYVDNDGSSIFRSGNQTSEITLIRAYDFIKESGISSIDLMKINIEGGEYDLLEHLIETDLVMIIKNIQVQFHDFVPNAVERMFNIQEKLEKTHSLTYQFLFVWENWKIN